MLEKLRNLCRSKPSSASSAQYARGMELYQQGRYEEAASCLMTLCGRKDSMGQLARYYRGMSYRAVGIEQLLAGEFAAAERQLQLAGELLGPQADMTAYLSSLYAQSGRPKACVAELEKAGASDGAAGAIRLAQAQWQAGQHSQAMLTLTEAMCKHGPEAQLHLQMGLFYAATENYDQARQSLARAAQADCTNAQAHHYLALVASASGDTATAFRSFQRALQLRPADVLLAYQVAVAARSAQAQGYPVVVQLPEPASSGAGAMAAQQLARFIPREKEFVEAFLSLPPSVMDAELFGTLASITRIALASHENYADLHYIFARIQQRLDCTETALEHARRAVQINGRYIAALILLADLLAGEGERTQAIQHLAQAVACGADWPDVHCRIGLWLAEAHQTQRARSHLERALQLKQDYPPAASALAALAA